MVNGDLIALADDLNDFSESEEELEPAATREILGSSEAAVDPRVDTADEDLKISGQTLSSEAAAAELEEMAKSDHTALEAANHSAAQTVASLNLKKHENSEKLLWDTARGRAEAGEDLGGVDRKVSAPGESSKTADAHDDGESSVPSAAPVKMKYDSLTTKGLVSTWRPPPEQVRGHRRDDGILRGSRRGPGRD